MNVTCTAACIHKRCSRSNVVLLYDRIIKAVYKTAWTDNAFPLDSGASPLKTIRQYRKAEWWQTHVFIAGKKAEAWLESSPGRCAKAFMGTYICRCMVHALARPSSCLRINGPMDDGFCKLCFGTLRQMGPAPIAWATKRW